MGVVRYWLRLIGASIKENILLTEDFGAQLLQSGCLRSNLWLGYLSNFGYAVRRPVPGIWRLSSLRTGSPLCSTTACTSVTGAQAFAVSGNESEWILCIIWFVLSR